MTRAADSGRSVSTFVAADWPFAQRAALKLSNGRAHFTVATPARLLSSDPSVILHAVKAGAGIGEVPEILAHEALRQGALIPLLPGWSLPTVDISIIYPRSRVLTPRAKALIDYLRKNIHSGPDLRGR